jgi:hypothetical protein
VQAVTDLQIQDETHLTRLLNWTGLGPQHYYTTYNGESLTLDKHETETTTILRQIKIVQSALTTSKRRYYRRKFTKFTAEIEEERLAGKPGRVIKTLLQKKRSVFDTNLLELPCGTLELDLEKAQEAITKELSEWMTGDPAHSTGINAPGGRPQQDLHG